MFVMKKHLWPSTALLDISLVKSEPLRRTTGINQMLNRRADISSEEASLAINYSPRYPFG